MTIQTDVIIVGAGHNGLVAAAILAKSGLKVTVVNFDSVVLVGRDAAGNYAADWSSI